MTARCCVGGGHSYMALCAAGRQSSCKCTFVCTVAEADYALSSAWSTSIDVFFVVGSGARFDASHACQLAEAPSAGAPKRLRAGPSRDCEGQGEWGDIQF
eukprot:6411795-Amphidinium_carterae.1